MMFSSAANFHLFSEARATNTSNASCTSSFISKFPLHFASFIFFYQYTNLTTSAKLNYIFAVLRLCFYFQHFHLKIDIHTEVDVESFHKQEQIIIMSHTRKGTKFGVTTVHCGVIGGVLFKASANRSDFTWKYVSLF